MADRSFPRIPLFVFFSCLYLLTTPGHLYTFDSWVSYETTQSLLVEGDLEISPNLITVPDAEGEATGRYGLLQSILCIPFYWVGDILDALFPFPDFLPENWRIALVATFNQFIAAWTLVWMAEIVWVLGFNMRVGWFVAMVFGFATPWWTYSRDLFRQPIAGLLFVWAVLAALRYGQTGRRSAALSVGFAMGLSVTNRITAVVAWPGIFFLFLSRMWSDQRARMWRVLWTIMGLVGLGILLQIAVNYWRFEDWWGNAYENRVFKLSFAKQNVPDLFLSPSRGLFLCAPILLLVFQGFRATWKLDHSLAVGIGLMVLAKIVMFSVYGDYTGGMNPGPRYLIPILPIFFLPVAILIARDWHQWTLRLSVLVLGGLGFAVNGYNTLVDYTRHQTFWDQVLTALGGWDRIVSRLGSGGYGLGESDNPFEELPDWKAGEVFHDVLALRWLLDGQYLVLALFLAPLLIALAASAICLKRRFAGTDSGHTGSNHSA